jgi:hypothetical protein
MNYRRPKSYKHRWAPDMERGWSSGFGAAWAVIVLLLLALGATTASAATQTYKSTPPGGTFGPGTFNGAQWGGNKSTASNTMTSSGAARASFCLVQGGCSPWYSGSNFISISAAGWDPVPNAMTSYCRATAAIVGNCTWYSAN